MNANTGTVGTAQATTTSEEKGGTMSGSKSRIVAIRQKPIEHKTELWQTVHVVGPENGPSFAQMLARAKCKKSEDGVQDADIVFFTGGAVDIHPMMYGVDPNDTHENVWFDNPACVDTMMEYIETWQECFYLGIPMVGICLGAQFLAVMNGSKLYQDVDGHNSDHPLYCQRTGKTIWESSSVHHQMVIEDNIMKVLATTCESNERWRNRTQCDLVIDKPDAEDVEAFWYEVTCSLGFQGHPEYQGYPDYTEWCLQQIQHYIIENPRLEYVNNNLRMKQEALQRRNFTLPSSVHDFIKEYK